MFKFFIFPIPTSEPTDFGFFLKLSLMDIGWVESSYPQDATHILVLGHPRIWSRQRSLLKQSNAKKILIRFEPRAVNPILYIRSTESFYHKIINIGSERHNGVPDKPIRWPYVGHPNPAQPDSRTAFSPTSKLQEFWKQKSRIAGACAILSNKIAWSSPSYYSLRRRIVLDSKKIGIKVFGTGWRKSRFQRLQENLRLYIFLLSQLCLVNPLRILNNLWFRPLLHVEEVQNKFDVLSTYEFSVVIENSPQYVSEKIIDAMIAGCIPIYIGPDLENFGIPADSFIALQGAKGELEQFLKIIKTIDVKEIRSKIHEFTTSPQGLALWHPKRVATDIVHLCQQS